MSFVLAKVVSALAAPGSLILLALALGAVLLWTRWRRAGRLLVTVFVVFAVAVATLPLGAVLLYPLEQRFAPPERLPDQVAGIIVLGGAVDPLLSQSRGQLVLGDSAERLIAGVELAHRFPAATFVFTGGSGSLIDQNAKEANAVAPVLDNLGLAPERIVLESQSRNTYENAVYTRRLIAPEPSQVWVLVTSAMHMPRAVGCFRAVGWQVLPYPVDYRTRRDGPLWWPPSFNLASGLATIRLAVHEWLGLLAYRLAGRTDSVLPAPLPSVRPVPGSRSAEPER